MKKNISNKKPEKRLTSLLQKRSGRSNSGQITIRHRGGREKRFYREMDFKRDKHQVIGTVQAFEYDPNRNVSLALIFYSDGEKRYILAPQELKIGDKIISDEKTDIKPGNHLKLKYIPVGTGVHNIEIAPGRGGQMVRGAGNVAVVLAHEVEFTHLKLPSTEIRMVSSDCRASIGQLGNPEFKNIPVGKAGRSRRMGRRPTVRGTAQHPGSHPHGGGEGRSGVGLKHPKTPWGKIARGKITRKRKKYSNKMIIKKRKK